MEICALMDHGSLPIRSRRSATGLACPACCSRVAFVQPRGPLDVRKELTRKFRSSRRSCRKFKGGSPAHAQIAASRGNSASYVAHPDAIKASNVVPGGRDFFQWILDLPWNRVGVWLAVAWFAYQLKDFFGVSLHVPEI